MPIEYIGVGTYPNDTTGDPLQLAFTKCNDNFNYLYGLGTGTLQFYQNQCVATLASGANDYGASPPTGFVQAFSNQLIFTANSTGSTLNGLLSATNGFTAVIYNPSTTGGITFNHKAASVAVNQFLCPNATATYLAPYSATMIMYLAGSGWVFL